MKPRIRILVFRISLLLGALGCLANSTLFAEEGSFYKGPPVFSTRPNETASPQTIARFGPVGMGIDLVQPAFRMKIHDIEEGSPAAATVELKAGQIIETINGQKLKDIDPRIQLGRILTDAEASNGVLKFVVRGQEDAPAQEVIVKVPVLGAYSKTWPLNFEEMKLPPFSYDQVLRSTTLVPMLTAEWQAKQYRNNTPDVGADDDDEVAEREGTASDGKFRYDGKFVPNPAIVGTWSLIGQVQEVDEFSPGKELERGRSPFRELAIRDGGRTDSPTLLWSGNTLMNLSRYEALGIVVKTIGGTDYLFVEAGGFHRAAGIRVGWKSPWCVMKRK